MARGQALKPRRCAARLGERFLAVRLPRKKPRTKQAARLRHGQARKYRTRLAARARRQATRSGRVTEPAFLCAPGQARAPNPSLQKCWHGSGRAPAGLDSFAPAPFRCTSATQIALPFRCIPTATNCRDRLKPGRAGKRWPIRHGPSSLRSSRGSNRRRTSGSR